MRGDKQKVMWDVDSSTMLSAADDLQSVLNTATATCLLSEKIKSHCCKQTMKSRISLHLSSHLLPIYFQKNNVSSAPSATIYIALDANHQIYCLTSPIPTAYFLKQTKKLQLLLMMYNNQMSCSFFNHFQSRLLSQVQCWIFILPT